MNPTELADYFYRLPRRQRIALFVSFCVVTSLIPAELALYLFLTIGKTTINGLSKSEFMRQANCTYEWSEYHTRFFGNRTATYLYEELTCQGQNGTDNVGRILQAEDAHTSEVLAHIMSGIILAMVGTPIFVALSLCLIRMCDNFLRDRTSGNLRAMKNAPDYDVDSETDSETDSDFTTGGEETEEVINERLQAFATFFHPDHNDIFDAANTEVICNKTFGTLLKDDSDEDEDEIELFNGANHTSDEDESSQILLATVERSNITSVRTDHNALDAPDEEYIDLEAAEEIERRQSRYPKFR